ncbi:redoxin domain-containing protein [bacterium]|nr:MAG: redoxin domain-containing protein [bacterium]
MQFEIVYYSEAAQRIFRFMKRLLPLGLTLVLALLVQAAPAPTTDLAKNKIQLEASAILDQSAQAYAALNGLSMQYAAFDDNAGKTTSSSGTIAFSRPGKARLDIKTGKSNFVVLSDGVKIYSQLQPDSYRVGYSPKASAIESVFENVPSALSLLLPFLAAGNNPLGMEGIKWQDVKLLPEGVSMSTKLGSKAPPLTFKLYFDPTDKLLRRAEAVMIVDGKKSVNLTTITNVRLNPEFSPTSFTFVPPAGAKEVAEAPLFNPELRVGTVPPELKGLDFEGKAHPWKDYEGKVVLLHFWMESSSPSTSELRNVLQNYIYYHEMGLNMIGIPLDVDKAGVQEFVKKNNLTFPQLFDGKGLAGADVTSYAVRMLPFSILVGKDGKIAAVNPKGQQLEPEIVKALAG